MRIRSIVPILALPMYLLTAPAHGNTGLNAALACEPAGSRLAYNCTIQITEQGTNNPVDGLAIQAKADMPSMPMAHNIPPVRAQALDEPGMYEFPITLDMYGRWAFAMTIAGPRQDMLVEMLDFEAPEGEEDEHDHHHHHGDGDDDTHAHAAH